MEGMRTAKVKRAILCCNFSALAHPNHYLKMVMVAVHKILECVPRINIQSV